MLPACPPLVGGDYWYILGITYYRFGLPRRNKKWPSSRFTKIRRVSFDGDSERTTIRSLHPGKDIPQKLDVKMGLNL